MAGTVIVGDTLVIGLWLALTVAIFSSDWAGASNEDWAMFAAPKQQLQRPMHSPAADPFADVLNLEENFYSAGHEHGFEQGKLAGFEEGRQLGVAKGFEIWEEVGFYQGFASLWREHHVKAGTTEGRAAQQASAILELASRFPTSNPKHEDFDVVKLLNQIRSKYKVLCATVGTRPRMFVSTNDS